MFGTTGGVDTLCEKWLTAVDFVVDPDNGKGYARPFVRRKDVWRNSESDKCWERTSLQIFLWRLHGMRNISQGITTFSTSKMSCPHKRKTAEEMLTRREKCAASAPSWKVRHSRGTKPSRRPASFYCHKHTTKSFTLTQLQRTPLKNMEHRKVTRQVPNHCWSLLGFWKTSKVGFEWVSRAGQRWLARPFRRPIRLPKWWPRD